MDAPLELNVPAYVLSEHIAAYKAATSSGVHEGMELYAEPDLFDAITRHIVHLLNQSVVIRFRSCLRV
jgi:hypothetical protein